MTEPQATAAAFDPFSALTTANKVLPSEPAVGSVLGWLNDGVEPAIAVHCTQGWYVDGEEEPRTWGALLTTIGHNNLATVGVAHTWRPLLPPAPAPIEATA